jgi:hypothetical protein
MGNFAFSPFIVPVAGCMVGIVAIISGIWLDGHKRRIRSDERVAMISRGVPLAEIEKVLGAGSEDKPPLKDPLRSLGNARRAGIILVSVGVGLVFFFIVLSYVVQERDVLAGAAAGIIPLAIGIGFFIDYTLQKRELSRFGLEVGAEPGSSLKR